MDDISANVEMLYEKAKTYAETNVELAKFNAIDKTADIVSSLASRAIAVMALLMFSLFVNIALSLYISHLIGSMYSGFLLVSFLYLIAYFVIEKYSDKYIKEPITNLVIAKLLKNKTTDQN